MSVPQLLRSTRHVYTVKNPINAFVRDLGNLEQLNAATVVEGNGGEYHVSINLDYPKEKYTGFCRSDVTPFAHRPVKLHRHQFQ